MPRVARHPWLGLRQKFMGEREICSEFNMKLCLRVALEGSQGIPFC